MGKWRRCQRTRPSRLFRHGSVLGRRLVGRSPTMSDTTKTKSADPSVARDEGHSDRIAQIETSGKTKKSSTVVPRRTSICLEHVPMSRVRDERSSKCHGRRSGLRSGSRHARAHQQMGFTRCLFDSEYRLNPCVLFFSFFLYDNFGNSFRILLVS